MLDCATLAEMREPLALADVPGEPWSAGYGLGLQLWNDNGVRSYGHTGSMPGFFGILEVAADGGDAAMTLSSSTAGFSDSLTTDLLRILAENEPRIQPEWAPAAVADDVLDLLGTWYRGPVQFTVGLTGGELEFRTAGAGAGHSFRFRSDGGGAWTGIDGYYAGEPLVPLRGPDGQLRALDLATHIYTRTPYDPQAPVPGGVDPDGWRADARHPLG